MIPATVRGKGGMDARCCMKNIGEKRSCKMRSEQGGNPKKKKKKKKRRLTPRNNYQETASQGHKAEANTKQPSRLRGGRARLCQEGKNARMLWKLGVRLRGEAKPCPVSYSISQCSARSARVNLEDDGVYSRGDGAYVEGFNVRGTESWVTMT